MTEDTSPENLRKFLESDDPAMVRMGLSMAKGSGVPENLLPTILRLYMWDDDKNIRISAKSVFNKYAPAKLQRELQILWKPKYRTLSPKRDKLIQIIGKLLKSSHESIARASIYPILRYQDEDRIYAGLLRNLSDCSGICQINEDEIMPDESYWTGETDLPSFSEHRNSPVDEYPHLLQSLTNLYDDSEEVRFQTISAMSKISLQNSKYLEYFVKALDDNSEKIRIKASKVLSTWWLYKMKDINPLLKALKDENTEVRENIVLAIGGLGKKKDAKHLLEFLEHKNKKIRSNAVKSLGKIRSNIAAEPLINLLKKLYEESKSTGPSYPEVKYWATWWGYNNPLAEVCRAIGNSIREKNIDQLLNLLKPPLHNFEDEDSDSISLTNEILDILDSEERGLGNKKALIEFTKIVEKIKNNPKITWEGVGGLFHKFCCFSDERALALVTVIKIAPQKYQEQAYNELNIDYDLKEFLRENKMKTSGTKKDLIERIKTLI